MCTFQKDVGCIHLLNTCKYCDKTCKYCGNTHEYWANTWKIWSPASAIFASSVTILVSFEAILKRFSVKSISKQWSTTSFKKHQNCFKTYKYSDNTREYYTCRWTHFSSIGSRLVSIIKLLNEYCHNTCQYWAGEYTPHLYQLSNTHPFLR